MFEKVNPSHPDKVADRIAGAIVDIAYKMQTNPRIAVEVLIGHLDCTVISEASVDIPPEEVAAVLRRIIGNNSFTLHYSCLRQDPLLASNQTGEPRCGDNGIFRGCPFTAEQTQLTRMAMEMHHHYGTDGKYLIDRSRVVVCQSGTATDPAAGDIAKKYYPCHEIVINPLGDWTGGLSVDTGATNRKLGSDMGDAVTGGGLHGKDLTKADVSLNVYCHIMAQRTGKPYELSCAIGDRVIDGKPYKEIMRIARNYIFAYGGFEKFAEWGLIM